MQCRHIIHSVKPPHHNHLWPFSGPPVEPLPEENFWSLWYNGRLTEADTPTIRLGTTPSGLTSAHLHHPPIFNRPDTLPAGQPTVSKHSIKEYRYLNNHITQRSVTRDWPLLDHLHFLITNHRVPFNTHHLIS